MKGYIYYSAIGVVSLLAACSTPQRNDYASMEGIDNFNVSQTIKSIERNYICEGANAVFDDSMSIYSTVHISVDWPVEMGNYDLRVLQDSLLSATFRKPAKTIDESMLVEARNPEGNDVFEVKAVDSIPANVPCMVYIRDVATQLLTVNPLYAVYQIKTSVYDGGAHGISETEYVNYDFRHMCVMTYDNMFRPGSGDELLQAVKDCLMTQYDVSSLAELDAKGIFSDQLFLTHNFYISGDSVVFHYNPYDIAPYSEGAIDVVVPYLQIADYVNSSFAHLFDPSGDSDE
jgi:Protein of unknown function (DUF3298)